MALKVKKYGWVSIVVFMQISYTTINLINALNPMSNFEKVQGEIVIPQEKYSVLKAEMFQALENKHAGLHRQATEIYEKLRDPEAVRTLLSQLEGLTDDSRNHALRDFVRDFIKIHSPQNDFDEIDEMEQALFLEDENRRLKIKAPVFKDHPDVVEKKQLRFSTDGGVYFDDENHKISIFIGGQNHSFNYAYRHYLYQMLDRNLKNMKWEAETGGVLYYEDSYTERKVLEAFSPPGANRVQREIRIGI